MQDYLALIRGINVGGKSLIKMADLREELASVGLKEIRTYIQSGNVLFKSNSKNSLKLGTLIKRTLLDRFNVDAGVAVFTKPEWEDIIAAAPKWWGVNKEWKHNLMVMTAPGELEEVLQAIGELKPGIEDCQPGNRVFYQGMSLQFLGRTTTGKLAAKPIYKQLTIRNYNTATKLLALFK